MNQDDRRSAHVDTFTAENLPPRAAWPTMLATPPFQYPERLNCSTALVHAHVAAGRGDHLALDGPTGRYAYAALAETVDRWARVLVEDEGLVPGNRVLLRGPNNAFMAIAWLAVVRAGGVVVATMPLLREKELAEVVERAQISHALCDHRLLDALENTRQRAPVLHRIATFGDGAEASVEVRAAAKAAEFAPVDTAADDTCLIAFTSGTTGRPKGTMHFHRDVLAICDAFPISTLRATRDDRFIGSPPLAFTFGLGGLLLFPLRLGATAVLVERGSPDALLPALAEHRATICFTSPTAYRAMAAHVDGVDLTALRKCVSAGETLPPATRALWRARTGIEIIDGIGSTELLHIFLSHTEDEARPGATGRPIPGYEAKVVDEAGLEVPRGQVGRLAVRGPTGCRYLADERQREYVQDGWNFPGDAYLVDEDGFFHYQARTDDLIITAGYNVAGPEVEAALLQHPAVAECGVVGVPDEARGQIIKAFVVLAAGQAGDAALVESLQGFVKATIAPYKYPRAIEFVTALPRTETGKLQRFRLRASTPPSE
ncbi:AMP-binding protein [Myxococcota bacterium]|nr:AMP-binding protein [Myxococcota bacterium]